MSKIAVFFKSNIEFLTDYDLAITNAVGLAAFARGQEHNCGDEYHPYECQEKALQDLVAH